jgi:hypothetical protein
MDAMNDDACALFASLSNSSGSTGVDLSIANVDDALYALARRGAMGELVGILDNIQAEDFQNALEAASTNMAVYAGAADRMMACLGLARPGPQRRGLRAHVQGRPVLPPGSHRHGEHGC